MADYENLGFQVNVDSDSAVSRLDAIIERLERIQKLEGKVGKGGSSSNKRNKKGFEHFSKTGGLNKQDIKNATRSGNYSAYDALKKQVAKEIELNHIWKEQIETLTQLNIAKQKKLTYEIIGNNQDVKAENVQAKIAEMTAKTAISNDLLTSAEGRLAIEKKANVQYDTNRIMQMAKLKKEQEDLSNGTTKEIRKIQILNKERQKEIDAQIKQELGIKDNTNALSKYIAKLTSVVIVAKKLAHFMSAAIEESAAYIENLNLFAVAYGETYQETLDWALDISKAYGLANNEVIKFAGTFRELSTSLGLVGDTADLVSQTVTNLGYDLSALFNTTVEQAMEKLQSGIFSGNVRPLRAYGIDISQNQIDALFETNEALKQLGVTARNLSQSDKVLARLIITLQSGKDSFGTMAREINNLQSQFRIFQGSLSNFKLALGDLLEKPLSKIMVLINAVVIALTNIIRTFVPLTKEDMTPKAIINTVTSAEDASKAIDELEGKLAGFDKFNVLQQGGQESSNLTITEALNQLLQEQANIYDTELSDAMEKMQNDAVELADKIQDVVVIVGTLLAVWSVAKLKSIIETTKLLKTALSTFTGTTNTLNKSLSLTNTLLVTGIIFAIYKAIEAFREGDTAGGILATTIAVALVGAWVALNWEMIKTKTIKIVGWFKGLSKTLKTDTQPALLATTKSVTTLQKAALAMSAAIAIGGLVSLLQSEKSAGEKVAHIFIGVAAAITAAAIAMSAFKQNWVQALAIAGTVAGGYFSIASMSSHADGGYSNANLIMTHENGKREWVGKAAGSSAIVNDTQMSDIMEGAVAKGVYQALTARSAMGDTTPTNETIVVKIGEEAVFNAVRRTAKRQGRDFATV